jgi:amino acid transporter
MSPKSTPESSFSGMKKTWGLLAQVAVFIFGVVGSFLLPPPGWVAAAGDTTVVRLAQFIVAVLAGLIFLLVQKWNRKKHVSRWAIIAMVCLVASVVAYFGYQHLLDTRTCEYAGHRLVVGKVFTPHAQTYVAQNSNSNCTTLLEDFAGKADDIWTRNSINISRYLLAGAYILNLPLFTICIIAVVQALNCSRTKARR